MGLSTPGITDETYWTFSQLCTEVINLTARPDRLTNVQSHVASTTMKLHSMDFFYKDIVSGLAIFEDNAHNNPAGAFIQQLDTSTLPRYRALKAIRKWDPTYEAYQLTPSLLPPLYGFQNINGIPTNPNLALKMLKQIDVDDIFDGYWTEKTDVFYIAGSSINIKSSTALSQAIVYWYAYPKIGFSDTVKYNSYNSWIAKEFPWAIIYDAAGAELMTIGEADAATLYIRQPNPSIGDGGGLVWEHINNMRNSNITAEAR